MTGTATIHIRHENLSIEVVIRSKDDAGLMVQSLSDGDFEGGYNYYIPYSNISWIKYPQINDVDEDYIDN